MDKLIKAIVRSLPIFVWLVLAIVSLTLLFRNNPYHRSIWFGSANRIVGSVYQLQNSVTGYFGLRDINEDLLERTGVLEQENLRLRQQLQEYRDSLHLGQFNDSLAALPDSLRRPLLPYHFMVAHVVGNSVNLNNNYITLDKGSLDGVRPDLGVADHNGIIGIVAKVSEHFSLVLSVLNTKFALSVKLKNSSENASLRWDGIDPQHALLADLPRNVSFERGDTVVTTGFTSTFPPGTPVGLVEDWEDRGGSFLNIRIRLFPTFNRLNDVHVIFFDQQEEKDKLHASRRQD